MDFLKRFFPTPVVPKFEPIKYLKHSYELAPNLENTSKTEENLLAILRCYKNLWIEEADKRKELEVLLKRILSNKKNKIEDKDIIEIMFYLYEGK